MKDPWQEAAERLVQALIPQLDERLGMIEYSIGADDGKIYLELINPDSDASFGIWLHGNCQGQAAVRVITAAAKAAWPHQTVRPL